MKSTIKKVNEVRWRDDPYVLERVRIVLEMIDEAIEKPLLQLKINVDALENQLVHLRDHLIDGQRKQSEAEPFIQSSTLERINIALSLIVSIGYPGAGIYREGLEETREMFKNFFSGISRSQF